MKAILLAGGKGTRLRPLTLHTPKPIVPIFDRPFLRYQIDLLRQVPEIDEIVLSLNYQPRRIEEVFGDGSDLGIHLRYVVEPTPLGTGGAIKFAAGERRGEPIVVFNGDVFTSVDLPAVLRAAPRAAGQGDDRADAGRQPVRLRPGRDRRRGQRPARSSRSRRRTRSAATRSTPASTCSSRTRSIAFPRDTVYSIERGYFPVARRRTARRSSRYIYRGYWIDIGTPEKYRQAHRDIMDGRFAAPPFAGRAGHGDHLAGRARRRRRDHRRPVLHRRRRGRQARRAHRALQRHRPALPHRRGRGRRRRDPLAEHLGRQRGAPRRRDRRPALPLRPQRRASARRRIVRRQVGGTDYSQRVTQARPDA